MTNKLEFLQQRSTAFSRSIAVVGLIGLIAVTLVIIIDVLLRWLFSSPIDGLNEVLNLLYAVVLASFFPTGLNEKTHITITFLGSWLGPKAAQILDTFGSFMTFLFFVVVGWQFIVLSAEFFESKETTWVLAWPVAPWWTVTTVLLLICIPVQLLMLISQLSEKKQETEN
tara:strand:+ start:688 stop:1197 length:510 start_codon:yes stop_codon:yes gene_type:complete